MSNKKILVIVGSATPNSSNLKLVNHIVKENNDIKFDVFDTLEVLPHFQTEKTNFDVPETVMDVRNRIEYADGVLFSTPEYIFSIPSRLKNLLEWCVSTVIFSNKPVAILTASAYGEMGHQELQFILKTLNAKVEEDHLLLIKGIKGTFDEKGIINPETRVQILEFFEKFKHSI